MDCLIGFKVFFFQKGDHIFWDDTEFLLLPNKQCVEDLTKQILPKAKVESEEGKLMITCIDPDTEVLEDFIAFERRGLMSDGFVSDIKGAYEPTSGVQWMVEYEGDESFDGNLEAMVEDVVEYRQSIIERQQESLKNNPLGCMQYKEKKPPRVMDIITVWGYHSERDHWTGEYDCWSEYEGILDCGSVKIRE
jgi:hypothetical protein